MINVDHRSSYLSIAQNDKKIPRRDCQDSEGLPLCVIDVHALPSNKFTIDAVLIAHQLVMSSLFGQMTFVNDEYSIAPFNGAQSMCRYQYGSMLLLLLIVEQRILNLQTNGATESERRTRAEDRLPIVRSQGPTLTWPHRAEEWWACE